jgi:toxin ParE1/3/4
VAEVKILWSARSLKDIEEIIDYISKDSPAAARTFATKIIEAVMVLETFPTIGRIVPEYNNPNIREVLYRNYRIVYELSGNTANIVTVFHGSRMLE